MGRILVAALVAGIVLFVWQFAAWMFLGIHQMDRDPLLPNEDAVVTALAGTERGVYWIPGGKQDVDPESDEYKAWEEKHRAGPTGFLVFNPEGGEPMSGATMAIGGGICVLLALVIALVLSGAGVRTFLGRVGVCFGIGVVLVLAMDMNQWNWQGYPDDWTRGYILDHLGGMILVGLVMGLILRPGREAAATE